MINQFAYFNTGKAEEQLEVTYREGTETKTRVLSLGVGEVTDNKKIALQLGLGGNQNLIESVVSIKEFTDNSGNIKKKKVPLGDKPPAFDIQDILKNSVILDIETQGKMAGASITQIAIYDIDKKAGKFIIPEANLLDLSPTGIKGEASYDSRASKLVQLPEDMTHLELKRLHTLRNMYTSGMLSENLFAKGLSDSEFYQQAIVKGPAVLHDPDDVEKIERFMLQSDKFQAKQYVQNEALFGNLPIDKDKRSLISSISEYRLTTNELDDYFKKSMGLGLGDAFSGSVQLVPRKGMRDIVREDMPEAFRGKVLWIANASFESKQFGAHLRGYEREVYDALVANKAIDTDISYNKFKFDYRAGKYEGLIDNFNRIQGTDYLSKNPFLGVMEGISLQETNPFYVTGKEYGLAKQKAYASGDFSGLYDVFKRTTRAGSVRDVLDLVRMQQSYMHKVGVLESDKVSSVGIEIQQRYAELSLRMKAAEEAGTELSFDDVKKALLTKETHVGIGDVLSEEKVMTASLEHLEALDKLAKGEADELLLQAKQGKGALFRALVVGGMQDYFNRHIAPDDKGLLDVFIRARGGRIMEDMAEQGYYAATKSKATRGYSKQQLSQYNDMITVKENIPVNIRSEVKLTRYDDIIDDLKNNLDYKGANKELFLEEFDKEFRDYFDDKGLVKEARKKELYLAAQKYSETADLQIKVFEKRLSDNAIDSIFSGIREFSGQYNMNHSDQGLELSLKEQERLFLQQRKEPIRFNQTRQPVSFKRVQPTLSEYKQKISAPKLIKGGLATLALMALGKMQDSERKDEGIIIGDYDSFLESQASFYGNTDEYIRSMKEKYGMPTEGFQEQGINALLRSSQSDFGSPYQGPFYSQSVFENQRLLLERERQIQARFGHRHFSEQGDIGYFLKSNISKLFKQQQGLPFIDSKSFFVGDLIDSDRNYYGLRGRNLVEKQIDINQFDIDVEDGDTIVLKRKGSPNNALSAFMGNTGGVFSIRLAGIDSPETAHEDRPAQFFAQQSKEMLSDMISGASDLRLVMRQDDTTYGRQVAMIYADGKNLNIEMLKRGGAAYLPYKHKGKGSMFNEEIFEKAQDVARENRRGMWKSSYFQAYSEIVKGSGETVTFNTLANVTKVAKSTNLMNLYSLMNAAEKGGMTSNIMNEIKNFTERLKYTQNTSSRSVYEDDLGQTRPNILDLQTFGYNPNSINTILDEVKGDLALQMQDSSGERINNFEQKNISNFKVANTNLNASEVYTREVEANERFTKRQKLKAQVRVKRMERMQQVALGNLFNSPIGHQRM